MRLGRRQLLKATLGLTQLGLIERIARAGPARAQSVTDAPDKLCTIFLPGGWMSLFAFCGLTPEEIAATMAAPGTHDGEPVFFTADDVVALDGSGSATAIRTPRLWDQEQLAQGLPDRLQGTSPNGWSWVQHQLWQNAVVVHGVDQMTVAHVGGTISALTGVASSDFKSPAVNAWAAHELAAAFPDRALPSVWIDGPQPQAHTLSGRASPLRVPQASALSFLFSDRRERAWGGLRASDIGSTITPVSFDGAPLGEFAANPIEDRVSRRFRALAAQRNSVDARVLEQVHDQLADVSRLLARDVTSVIESTVGHEHTPVPFWATGGNRYGVDGDGGGTWEAQFDLALRMLKSNLVTSVAVEARGPGAYGFDSGHSDGHRPQFAKVRGAFEIIGRFLGEMKATPGAQPNKTLLDETLVLVISDFARTWPLSGPTSDHWPASSVAFIGGGLNANTMIGGYDVDLADPNATGFDGRAIAIDEEESGVVTRRPRSADVVSTALAVMGIGPVRIPNGNGEIVGVRA